MVRSRRASRGRGRGTRQGAAEAAIPPEDGGDGLRGVRRASRRRTRTGRRARGGTGRRPRGTTGSLGVSPSLTLDREEHLEVHIVL